MNTGTIIEELCEALGSDSVFETFLMFGIEDCPKVQVVVLEDISRIKIELFVTDINSYEWSNYVAGMYLDLINRLPSMNGFILFNYQAIFMGETSSGANDFEFIFEFGSKDL